MKTINVLIIASSDMDGTVDDHNLPASIIDVEFPCKKYDGLTSKNINDKINIATRESPRCNKCKYTEIEHKYGYPMWPKTTILGTHGYPVQYSDLWYNRYGLFDVIKKMVTYKDYKINYQTCNPAYKNNLGYLPIIKKMNDNVAQKLGINGGIHYVEPYDFECKIEDIKKHPQYKDNHYDIIFIVSGGIGWLYAPKPFAIIKELLPKDMSKPSIIVNFDPIPYNQFLGIYPEFSNQFKPINPINSALSLSELDRQMVKSCIRNYSKVLLDDRFVEIQQILLRKPVNSKKKKTQKRV